MISNERLEKALTFIAESDREFAEAKTEVERATWLAKQTRAIQYELADGKSIEDKKQAVERSSKVNDAEDRRIKAIGVYEYLRAKRASEEIIIQVWRSIEASRRKETVS